MRKLLILSLLFFMIVLNGVVFNVMAAGDHGHKDETPHAETPKTDNHNKKETHSETPKKKQTHSKTSKHDNM